jgi:hypothetical protein
MKMCKTKGKIKGGVQGVNTFGVPLLDATAWHLGTTFPLKGKVQGKPTVFLRGDENV